MSVALHPNHPDAREAAAALPCNLDAEQALLGAVLCDNEAFHLIDGLEAKHFYEPLHERLWAWMAERIGKGVRALPELAASALNGDTAFEELGGIRYLGDLLERAPPASDAPTFAQEVIDLATRRELLGLAGDIAKSAREAGGAGEVIEHAEAALLAMQVRDRREGLITAGAASAKVLAYLDEPADAVHGVRTCIAPLDEELGPLLPGNLILFMGRPSMGKSTAGECVALNIAEQGLGVVQINGEMSEEEMAQRHLSDICQRLYGARGPEYRDIRRKRVSPDQRGMLQTAHESLDGLPLVMRKRTGLRLSQMRSLVRRQATQWSRRGIPFGALVVDHVGLIRADGNVRDRYEAQTLISNGMKELADELACPIIALNQMNREAEKRDDKRPQLSDLRDSGSWEQDADIVIGWFREAYYAQRQTEPETGKPGAKGIDQQIAWDEWNRARRSKTVEAIILKARSGPPTTVKLWGDVARSAIRGAAPEGALFDE